MPKVSIIIPCCNVEKYLAECLDSVLRQTLVDWEAVCVDDGSTDATACLLDGYRARDSRIRVLHQTNQGVSASRNTGIGCSSGEYIAFLDPDDYYPDSGVLELLYTKAHETGARICGGSFSVYNSLDGSVTTRFRGDAGKYTFREEGFVNYRDYQFDFGYHRFLYLRSFLTENRILFPPYARFQDPPFFVNAMIRAGRFYAVPHVVYRYREGIQAGPEAWSKHKLHDLLRGHLDNLILSAQAQLYELHALTVRRLEAANVYEPVMKSLREKDPQTLSLLIQINAAINTDLLRQAGTALTDGDCYLLGEFDTLLKAYAKSRPGILRRAARLVHGALQCCADHGLLYTIERIYAKYQGGRP